MTIYDFFINQTVKEIQKAVREKTWFETFHNVPGDLKSWCKLFKLDEDPRVTELHIFDYRGVCRLTLYVNFDFGPIIGTVNWGVEYIFKGRNNKVTVAFKNFTNPYSTGSPEVFHDKYIPGTETEDDKRYNDLGYDVPLAMFADSYVKDETSNTYIPVYDPKNSPQVYINRINEFFTEIAPYMQEFYDSLYNGEFDKQWAKFYIDEPRNGNMTNSGILGPGMRGIVNVRYWAKHFRNIELSQEDVICLTCVNSHSAGGGWGRNRNYIHPLQERILYIEFLNRGAVNESFDDVTAEKLLECLETCRKVNTVNDNKLQLFKDEFRKVCEHIWKHVEISFNHNDAFDRIDRSIVAAAVCRKLRETYPVSPDTECSFNGFEWTGSVPENYTK